MSRRPAVLLTSPRHIPNSWLFRFFCTVLQKSEAHPLPFQPLPASLQKPQACRQERFFDLATRHSSLATSPVFFTLLHQSESHPLNFQSFPHSLCVYPGWYPERFLLATRHSSLATKCIRINTCKTVSKQRTLTSFRINTYTKSGGGPFPEPAGNAAPFLPGWVILPSAFWRYP
jgi:hypothetical protein